MRFLVLLTALLTAGAAAAETEKKYADWVINTPKGHGSYCISMKSGQKSARKAAILFAGQSIGNGVEHQEVSGAERAMASSNDGDVSSRYEQNIEIITVGDAPTVQLVDEQQVDGQLCVLVKAG
ncbi:hypothetical protein [Vibrio parahaemolyticus]|uniref:hypothetical protein n=1 Tax=Vibrio parahaemolyticus TaxID=670 RepID=UPI0023EDF501|nr:hypothetical protein [Vibrio parahaemolyticus]